MPAAFIICTTPRSGSTLLCDLLSATGCAGRPDSFWHEPHVMREWAEAWGLPRDAAIALPEHRAAYLRAAIRAGRAGTPLFGMRLQHAYLAPLCATLDEVHPGLATDADRLARAFGPIAYLHLARRDKVAQAVSLVKARQGGLWHRHADGSERERTAPPRALVYDAAALEAAVDDLTRGDRAWQQWFDRQRITPFHIAYETFAADPAATLVEVCDVLGVRPPSDAGAIRPGLARLSDAESLQWADRYRCGRAAGSATPRRASSDGSDQPIRSC